MEWIKMRFQERDELRKCKETLKSGTPPLWKGLCQALQDSVNEYGTIFNYGRFEQHAYNHHVFYVRYLEDTPNHNTEKKSATIVLDAKKGTIHSEYDGVDYPNRTLKLNLGEDETVCLREGDNEFNSEEASAYFLDPFLFPDLAATPLPQKSAYDGIRSVG